MVHMRVLIVIFHLPKGTSSARHWKFRQSVYGVTTSSGKGRYRYRRIGLLDDIPHVKLYWGAILILQRDLKRLKELLETFSAEFETREVKPTKADLKELGVVIQ